MNQEHTPDVQRHLENHAFQAIVNKDFSPASITDRYKAAHTYLDLDLLDRMLNKHGFDLEQINTGTFETFDEETRNMLGSKFSSLTAEAKYIQDKEAAASIQKVYTEEIADLLIASLIKTS